MKLRVILWDVIIIGHTAASIVIKHSLGSILMKNFAEQKPNIYTPLHYLYKTIESFCSYSINIKYQYQILDQRHAQNRAKL